MTKQEFYDQNRLHFTVSYKENGTFNGLKALNYLFYDDREAYML